MQSSSLLVAIGLLISSPPEVDPPRVLDDRLAIDLFAAEPDIVTPVGIAVDDRGRVLVIESHTHFRPEGYEGPPADRIRMFEDTDGDGRADRIRTFFEGTEKTMALAFARDGSLYVATRAEVFRLRDTDDDGSADDRTTIVRLETPGTYPHNGLSGFAFDFDGNVYFGLGENLGASYDLIGSDGTVLSGGGEGGNVYRCRPDGSGLVRVATGFWNPFALCFDAFGRLFAVDNDPDSRPPCRLLHVVAGADFGFRFRNGRKGLHPFTAWDGELPGTLPMVSGTGEAPSGVLAYESDHLPADYRGDLLVTSWGDHRIDRFRLRDRGASFTSAAEPIIAGGEDFRPVGIAVAPDGSLFVSDWVDKSYPIHGRGRIWHIRAVDADDRPRRLPDSETEALAHPDRTVREDAAHRIASRGASGLELLADVAASHENPRARAVALLAMLAAGAVPDVAVQAASRDPSDDIRALAVRSLPVDRLDLPRIAETESSPAVQAEALRRIADAGATAVLFQALESDDPFLRQAARVGLRRSLDLDALIELAVDDRPAVRLAALLLLRDANRAEARRVLPLFLDDSDPAIRFAAIQWVGERGLDTYRPALEAGLASGAVTRRLFEGYLAALERLDGDRRDTEIGGQDYVAALVQDPETPDAVLRLALRVLRPDHPALSIDRLTTWLGSDDLGLRLEAVRTLRESPHPDRFAILADLARDDSRPDSVRAEAIVGLPGRDDDQVALLVDLAAGGSPPLRREALRSLRGVVLTEGQRARLSRAVEGDETADALFETRHADNRFPEAPDADDLDAWLARLEGPADPAEGQRLFFHPKGPGCARCHEVEGRGGRIGPALSATGQELDRPRLVSSILQPSEEIAPQFVPWLIARTDGTIATGLLVGETIDGHQIYADSEGRTFSLHPSEIAERRPQSASIMPDDLARTMTPQEFRDLLSYLQSLSAAERSPSASP